MIYLDSNATTPLLPEVLEAMLPWLRDCHANPSGAHRESRRARRAIDEARGQIAELIGAEPEEIVFTGGGTESVNSALHALDSLVGDGTAVVSAIEHSAVLRFVETRRRLVATAGVGRNGRLNLTELEALLNGAAFVSIMTVNNETGVIQPIREIADLARSRGLPVHSDAIQAAGKIPFNVRNAGLDLASISAHKFHGPKGVGALFIRRGLKFAPLLIGGGQENGRRSGTENTPGIVGMGAAAAVMRRALAEGSGDQIAGIRDAFEAKVRAEIAGVTINGDPAYRLPNTTHLSFEQCEAAGLLILLDDMGVACSAGSACMTGKQRPSHVQLAMGIEPALAKSSLRISFSILNTLEEALTAADALGRAVEKLRRVQGSRVGPVVVYTK
jgi:cysteine desulfurase